MTNRTHRLQITRELNHDRARVFSALTDPVKMAQWFFGMEGGRAEVTNDLRPGGRYSIKMTDDQHTCAPHGTYIQIVPPEKLVFTWTSETLASETRVTIELFEHDAGTKLVLTHELPEDQSAPHREGWTICVDHLDLYLGGRLVAPAAQAASVAKNV